MCLCAPPLNFPFTKNVVSRAWFRATFVKGADETNASERPR
jgi:hypothetical protein